MSLSNDSLSDLQWWRDYLKMGPPSRSLAPITYTLDFYSDSTLKGWGALIHGNNAKGTFSRKQDSLLINTKELLAMYYGLCSFKHIIKGHNVLCHCDNTMAVSCIVHKGSVDKIRNAITKHIFELGSTLGCRIHSVHVSGCDNSAADGLSRSKEIRNTRTEWSLHKSSMLFIKQHLSFTSNIDLFASHLNFKFKPYCSFKPDPFAMHVDAFTINWNNWTTFAYPTFSLLNRCLAKLDTDSIKDIAMIIPVWPTAPFFRNLLRHLKAPPILLTPNTVKLMRLPWDQTKQYPLKNLRLALTHLCAACYAPKTCPKEWLHTLQIMDGEHQLLWS